MDCQAGCLPAIHRRRLGRKFKKSLAILLAEGNRATHSSRGTYDDNRDIVRSACKHYAREQVTSARLRLWQLIKNLPDLLIWKQVCETIAAEDDCLSGCKRCSDGDVGHNRSPNVISAQCLSDDVGCSTVSCMGRRGGHVIMAQSDKSPAFVTVSAAVSDVKKDGSVLSQRYPNYGSPHSHGFRFQSHEIINSIVHGCKGEFACVFLGERFRGCRKDFECSATCERAVCMSSHPVSDHKYMQLSRKPKKQWCIHVPGEDLAVNSNGVLVDLSDHSSVS
jgi:hypothetical protein